MHEKTWLTYAEAAAEVGLTVEGLRQRARREHWRKMLGNDGKALIMLPDDIDRLPPGEAAGEQEGEPFKATRLPPASPPGNEEAFTTLVASLQDRVAELREDLERERTRADAEIARERERAEEAIAWERAERAKEREQAERTATELSEIAKALANAMESGAARERELIEKLAEARKAGRGWWPWRRAG